LLERAQEIIGETAVQGLINPFDSDYINDNKEIMLLKIFYKKIKIMKVT